MLHLVQEKWPLHLWAFGRIHGGQVTCCPRSLGSGRDHEGCVWGPCQDRGTLILSWLLYRGPHCVHEVCVHDGHL